MNSNNTTKLWSAIMFITLGLIFLIENFFPELNFEDFWPVLLIITGIIMIFNDLKSENKKITKKKLKLKQKKLKIN